MECLKDWNEAALHFTGCYLLMKKKDKTRFALLHTTVCLVQIYRTTVQFTTSQPCKKHLHLKIATNIREIQSYLQIERNINNNKNEVMI